MKQLLQSLRNGDTLIADVPAPFASAQQVLIQTQLSLISAGTEKMILDFGKANILNKIRQQPDKVRLVIDKINTDGLLTTLDTVRNKLDEPIALGYCNVGRVIAVGSGVKEFSVGDRVVSNGHHAEIVAVNKNLCAKIPDQVKDEEAVFTVLAAIALQGIRLIDARIGETYAVFGLGLIGLLTVQLLKAQGCQVIGLDINSDKVQSAQSLGALGICINPQIDCVNQVKSLAPNGVDGALLTLSNQSSDPVAQAAQMCRKRGKIVLVGVTGLKLSRADFYEKELSFQVSCSYGPGRYDSSYEELGQDYPFGYVRWTEQRNFGAIIQLISEGKIKAAHYISHRFNILNAQNAYQVLGQPNTCAVVLDYPDNNLPPQRKIQFPEHLGVDIKGSANPGIGFIGSGNYARRHLIPAFSNTNARLIAVSCSSGISGAKAAKEFKMHAAVTDNQYILGDADCELIVISTRHNSHGQLVQQALAANKHVFVEKPLCLNQADLDTINSLMSQPDNTRQLTVGFNRRFSKLTQQLIKLVRATEEPIAISYTVNAGFIPLDHWTQDPAIGGGRLLGEVCHFIDLCRYITSSPIVTASIVSLKKADIAADSWQILLGFANGSTAAIQYLTNSNKSLPKEHIVVSSAGKTLVIDNFRTLECWGFGPGKSIKLWRQDKGQVACAAAVIAHLTEKSEGPIPYAQIAEVMQICLNLWEQVKTGGAGFITHQTS